MTREQIRANINLMIQLTAAAWSLADEIIQAVAADDDEKRDAAIDIMLRVSESEYTEAGSVMERLEKRELLDGIETGNPVPDTFCRFEKGALACGIKYSNGEMLQTTISQIDDGTLEAGLLHTGRTGTPTDLALARSAPSDNADIEMLVYADPYSEDYTHRHVLRHEDILTATDEAR